MFFKTPKDFKRLEMNTHKVFRTVYDSFEKFQDYSIVPFVKKFGNTIHYKTSLNATKTADLEFKFYNDNNIEIKDDIDIVFINFNVMRHVSGYSGIVKMII